MRKLLTSLIAISMLMPSTVLASSIRPGSPSPRTTYKGSKGPSCLVLVDDGDFVDKDGDRWTKGGSGNETWNLDEYGDRSYMWDYM